MPVTAPPGYRVNRTEVSSWVRVRHLRPQGRVGSGQNILSQFPLVNTEPPAPHRLLVNKLRCQEITLFMFYSKVSSEFLLLGLGWFSRAVVSDSATLWTVVSQASLTMGFPRQEYWSGLPFLSPGDLPNPGIKPKSPNLAGRFFTTESPEKPQSHSLP